MKTVSSDGAPVPRRTTRPRWLDVRVVGGVLLVIAAVVVGARVVGASSHTTPVWAASHNLAAGTVLTAADLTAVDVNLAGNATHYVAAAAGADGVVGFRLGSGVDAGELLPLSALQEPPAGKVVVIGVSPDRMPPGVTHGSVIDLYLTTGGATTSSTAVTTLVSAALVVQSVLAPASGGLSGATSNRYQIAVLVSAATADLLVKTLPRGDAVVVLVAGAR